MRFVDFDEVAAQRAVLACRDAADRLRELATRLLAMMWTVDWVGGARRAAEEDAGAIADALRRRADELDGTADAIAASIVAALREEERLLRLHLERLRECATPSASAGEPLHVVESTPPSPPPPSAPTRVPAGVR